MSRSGTMDGGQGRAMIRRGAQPRRRPPAKARARKKAPARSPFASLPPPVVAIARKVANYALVALLIGGVAAGVWAMRLPQMVGTAAGEAVGRAGFAVKKVEITGIDRMDRGPVEDAAFSAQELAMPLVDLAEIRGRLLQQGWVKDARVSRRLPDTLVIDIVEREPAAIWQHRQRLHLIDADGRVIAQLRLAGTPLPDLPILIGPNANYQVAALDRLLASSPQLKPMLDGATWVGDRRWDIRFRSGETLSLPEGEGQARAALAEFAERDRTMRLLGQGMLRFDMRNPGRIIVRPAARPAADQASASVRPATDNGEERPPASTAAADARSI
ncbi:cell division protein FtsQ/DivIB [Sphingomonas fennica]|uniref:Cell division protein FtsQ n=1 Tax=Edaphosphingomonas fennica TaxID=114404 RepID=A0A2T4I526_9SPHN|nr:cell division protein FtsQ/DivIB [Sphingomonas fennica]PTD24985.1 cell division protein FtsQ [Sphingomonas fennica]